MAGKMFKCKIQNEIIMKYYLNILIALLGVSFFSACDEEPIGQQPMDSTPPGKISNVSVRSIAGGAVFRYSLPADEDLLCIKAVYSIDGKTFVETKASAYVDSLMIRGFGNTLPYQVKLISVDKSRNESEAHVETITPLTPDVITIFESMDVVPDFGGLMVTWDNPNRSDISVNVEIEDHNNEYVPMETFYSSMQNGKSSIRGMDTIPFNFRTYVRDHWGNRSEMRYDVIVPIYETKFDRAKFAKVTTPGDIHPYNGDYDIHRIWDGNMGGDPCYSSPAGTGIWPQSVSFDLGVVGKISRFRLYQRTSQTAYIFHEGNMRNFEVWGCETFNPSQEGWGQWTKLIECESIKPSGFALGLLSLEDEAQARNGEDFISDPNNPPVRYIRILCKRTWADGANFQIGEVEIYGDNRPSVIK